MPAFTRLPRLACFALLLAPLAAPAQAPEPAPQSSFRPDLFFAGRTRGAGTIVTAMSSRPKQLSVEGVGSIAPDGLMTLDQAVTIDGKSSLRRFAIRRVSANAWQGTLSDAQGPVRGEVVGNNLRLHYRLKDRGMLMNQLLTLQPGGRTLRNRGVVTLYGMRVARIDETIEKLD